MKKLLSFILLALVIALSLASCSSIATYEKNLGDDYELENYDEDEMDELAELFDIDIDDYGIISVTEAKEDDTGYYAFIIKCSSNKNAKQLVEDLDDTVDLLDEYYSFEVDAVADGKFVLVGNARVIDDALDK